MRIFQGNNDDPRITGIGVAREGMHPSSIINPVGRERRHDGVDEIGTSALGADLRERTDRIWRMVTSNRSVSVAASFFAAFASGSTMKTRGRCGASSSGIAML
jgi:hypothetical protein